jgi:hypothetical protein
LVLLLTRALRGAYQSAQKARLEKQMKATAISILTALFLLVLAIIGGSIWWAGSDETIRRIGMAVLTFAVVYSIFSGGMTDKDQVAAAFLFGHPLGNLKKGPYFLPAGIVSVAKELGTIFEDELPAAPEKIYDGEGAIPAGMFAAIRQKFGPAKPDGPDADDDRLKSDPYNFPMVVKLTPVVNWYIDDMTMFAMNVGTVENGRKIMSDKATELFGNEFADVTPARAMRTLPDTNTRLKAKLQEAAKDNKWGIKIGDGYLKPFGFSKALNTSVVAVGEARENAKVVILNSEGEMTKRVNEAKGAAEALNLNTAAEKARLVDLGLATVDATGKITGRHPDPNTKVIADAIGKLSEVKGTLVLGDGAKTVMSIKQQPEGGQE